MHDSEELVTRAARGDREALGELLARDLPRLRAFVRMHMGAELRAKESASDLVQSACRDVLEHFDRFRHESAAGFRHWLFTTALRAVRNRARHWHAGKRNAGREIVAETSAEAALADYYQTLSTPSQKLMHREQIEQLERALDGLPAHYREVVLLGRVAGMPAREVGAVLGLTEEATRSLLRRALAELAEMLERYR